MDRALPENVITSRKIKRISIASAIIILIALSFFSYSRLLVPHVSADRIMTAVVEEGPVEVSLTASGIVMPRYERVITSPIQTNILAVYHKAGEKIGAGGQLLQLNREFIEMNYERLKDELELKKTKKQQQEIALRNIEIESTTQYDIQELNVKYNNSKLNREERLLQVGGATKESVEQVKLNLEISVRERERLRAQIENQIKLHRAELKELDLQIRIQEKNLHEMARQIELAGVRSENEGIITWINDKIGTSVNIGEVIARVADLTGYGIEASISDIHAGRLNIGSPVKIKLNDTYLDGKINSINPAASNGTVQFSVSITRQSHPQLRPNLRVEIFVLTSIKTKTIRIKNGPFYNGSLNQRLFVIKGNEAEARTVETGNAGIFYIELKKGLAPGERVIISDMKDYEDYNKIKIR